MRQCRLTPQAHIGLHTNIFKDPSTFLASLFWPFLTLGPGMTYTPPPRSHPPLMSPVEFGKCKTPRNVQAPPLVPLFDPQLPLAPSPHGRPCPSYEPRKPSALLLKAGQAMCRHSCGPSLQPATRGVSGERGHWVTSPGKGQCCVPAESRPALLTSLRLEGWL